MEMIKDELCDDIIEAVRKLTKDKDASKITVRDVLKELDITNRVFYNRFHNIDEVFELIYSDTVNKVRESLAIPYEKNTDFGEHIITVATRTLILTYESRQYMSQYIFEADSTKNSNFDWWSNEIKQLIKAGEDMNYLKSDIDADAVCYSIWCFIRGFNADALARNLPQDEAIRLFKIGFGCLIDGIKA